jgi:hypothetical protein
MRLFGRPEFAEIPRYFPDKQGLGPETGFNPTASTANSRFSTSLEVRVAGKPRRNPQISSHAVSGRPDCLTVSVAHQ